LPTLGDNPAPGISESIQHGIFAYFVPPVTLYALLGLIMWVTKRGKIDEKKEIESKIKEKEGESK